jgi:hypothetical protein
MNFISFEKAYALYPYETFENRRSFVCGEGPRREIARQKYVARGWSLLTNVAEEERKVNSALRPGHRWVGDRFCWTYPLSRDGLDLSLCATPKIDYPFQDNLTLHTWIFRYIPRPKFVFKILESPVLKTNYIAADGALLKSIYSRIKKTSIYLRREGHFMNHRLPENELWVYTNPSC